MATTVRYRYRCYPTPGQQRQLARTFGCVRRVFNDALNLRRQRWDDGNQPTSYAMLDRQCVTVAKRTPSREFLSEVSTVALQQGVRDLHTAYTNWWKSLSGQSQAQQRPPRHRRRRGRQSFRLTRRGFRVRGVGDGSDGAKVHLAKIGWVKVAWSRILPSQPTSVTVIKEPDGRYYLSFVVERDDKGPLGPAAKPVCGIDVGLTHLATIVSTDGTVEKVDNPRYLQRAQRRLVREQRSLARRQKGSRNRTKQRQLVATQHRKVKDARHDNLRKLARRIINDTQVVVIEGLDNAGLCRGPRAAQIHDAGWSILRRFLHEYADAHPDRSVVEVDPAGTTRRCSYCGCDGGRKPLRVRAWTCQCCDSDHDRDINAAHNILIAAGHAEIANACGGDVSLATPAGIAG